MKPRLITFKTSNRVFINTALYDFIKSCNRNAGDSLVEGDKILFFKNVYFKRELLQVSHINYTRVIKMENASAVVVNPNFSVFGVADYLLKDGTISKTSPVDESLIDDMVIEITGHEAKTKEIIEQYFLLAQLPKLPKIINEADLKTFINSGVIIPDEMIDDLLQTLEKDSTTAYSILSSVSPAENMSVLLFLLYSSSQFELHSGLFNNLGPTLTFLRSKFSQIPRQMTQSICDKICENPELKKRMLNRYSDLCMKAANGTGVTDVIRTRFKIKHVELECQ